ncbi:MAG: response regulator, partial [Cyanobacteria bacterium J06642_11]
MSERPLQLMLVDEDPTFRLGLRVWLEQLPGFQIAAEAASAADAMDIIRKCDRTQAKAFTDPTLRGQATIDLVLVDIGLGAGEAATDPLTSSGLQLCKSIKTEFPKLSVLVLSARDEPVLEAAARQVGANGYGTRSMPVRELAQLIRFVAAGKQPIEKPPQLPPPVPGPLTAMRLSMRLAGVDKIDQQLAKTTAALRRPRLPWLERQVLTGQLRELKAARWCLQQLWSTRQYADASWVKKNTRRSQQPLSRGNRPTGLPSSVGAAAAITKPEPTTPLSLRSGDVQNMVFEAVFAKLQTDLQNTTPEPLEIDILRLDKKQELLFIILRRFEDLLDDLRQSAPQPGQLRDKSPQILRDLWVATIEEFFGRYYTVPLNGVEQELVAVLYDEKEVVEQEILKHIPLVPELLAHWLYQDAMVVEGTSYIATTPEALAHSEKLLEN